MPDYDGMTPGQVLADASVAEFIKSLGLGIAEAQRALDENSVDQIGAFIEPRESLDGKSLLDLGLSPAFYHYQYADLVCSLQLSLRVEKDFSIGLNLSGSYSDTTTENNSSSESETTSESGSSTSTEVRSANIQINRASLGSLTVSGQNFSLSGNDAAERMRNLQEALTSDPASGIARVLYRMRPSPITITTDATDEEVRVGPNTVAFLGGGFDQGIIRIGENTNTDYLLDDTPETIATTTAQASLAEYAAHVDAQVQAANYFTLLVGPDEPFHKTLFDTGKREIPAASRAAEHRRLANIARFIRDTGTAVEIEGYADRQRYANRANSEELNRQLGDDRAEEIQNILLANGAPANKITMIPSRGTAAAAEAGDADGTNNQEFRKAEIRIPGRTAYLLYVAAREGGPNLNAVTPDQRGNGGNSNGFIYLYNPSPLELAGKKATIDGIDSPFRGAAAGGHAENTPEAYALNLATDINANGAADLEGSASGNVTTVTRGGDPYEVNLITVEQREINLSASSGITVTRQFSRTRSTNVTRQNTGNRTVAVGASLDVRYSRQFEMNVTGNSSISARLVSIPAPPQFLETIKSYLDN